MAKRVERAGVTWSTLPASRREWRSHLDRVIAEHSAPLVHTHFTAADLSGAAAAKAAGIPCVWHFHTGFDGYPLSRRLTDLIKMRLVARRRVARIVAVSQWLADFAVRRGAPAQMVEVIPNAIASERFEQLPTARPAPERFGSTPMSGGPRVRLVARGEGHRRADRRRGPACRATRAARSAAGRRGADALVSRTASSSAAELAASGGVRQ